MSAGRLTSNQKEELVESFRRGETTASIAQTFGCSPNTVNRTVKLMLSDDEYLSLKAIRSKGGAVSQKALKELSSNGENESFPDSALDAQDEKSQQGFDLALEEQGPLALDDADDFQADEEAEGLDEINSDEIFHEEVPFNTGDCFDDPVRGQQEIRSQALVNGLLPSSVYMLVDKMVELDARPLRDFSEFSLLNETEKNRKAICLFSNPRSARRQCGHSQRVIKVPDSAVFELSVPYLLARGITRLVLQKGSAEENLLIALDI